MLSLPAAHAVLSNEACRVLLSTMESLKHTVHQMGPFQWRRTLVFACKMDLSLGHEACSSRCVTSHVASTDLGQ